MTLPVPTDPNLTELASAKSLPAMLTHVPPPEGPEIGETLVTTGGFEAAEAAGSALADARPVASRSAGVTTATMRIPRDFARWRRTASTGSGAARRRLMTGLFLLRRLTGAVDSQVIDPGAPSPMGPSDELPGANAVVARGVTASPRGVPSRCGGCRPGTVDAPESVCQNAFL